MTRLYRLDAGPHPPPLNDRSCPHRLSLYGALSTVVAHKPKLQPASELTTGY